MRAVLVLATALLLFAQGALSQQADGERVFARCSSCHALDPDRRRPGPHLLGVVGRKAGSVEGFRYSPALREAGEGGLVWDEAALDAFLASPNDFLPGTTMRVGVSDAEQRTALLAYLRSASQ
ncbi:cytochrome c family protein [Nitratireductor sp. ZSWI3]|uniref:c-type cytochrome n=1 Tax=Nitratireductor sp. ZSWI3 TaxID=2966359 RepID=UPI00215040C3|nr:c-type cytochrome [Nitratireductor sp. ZSWI3]MCR4267270.1 c-type cytochrome [Nitratireductor sp. ZSWI3]